MHLLPAFFYQSLQIIYCIIQVCECHINREEEPLPCHAYEIQRKHSQCDSFGRFYSILLKDNIKFAEFKSCCRQQTVVALLASLPAYHAALYFTVFISRVNSMIVNLSDAISVSGCHLRTDG